MSNRVQGSSSLAAGDVIRVKCKACEARFKVPISKAGKRGPCPKCGQPLVIPKPKPVTAPVAAPVAAPSSVAPGEVDWNSLAESESQAAPDGSEFKLADDAVYAPAPAAVSDDKPVKRKLSPRERAAMKAAQPKPQAPKAEGFYPSNTAGLLLAIAGALLGGAIWFGLFYATGKEMKLVAWLLGILAGGGMWLGRGGNDCPFNRSMGMAALTVLIGLVTIVGVKLLIHEDIMSGRHYGAEIKRQANEYIDQEILYLEQEWDEPFDAEYIRITVHDWLGDDYRREIGFSDERYRNMPERNRMAVTEDIRLKIHHMTPDEKMDLFRRAMLAEADEIQGLDQIEADYRAARKQFIADNDIVDPNAEYDDAMFAFETKHNARIADEGWTEDDEEFWIYTDEEEAELDRIYDIDTGDEKAMHAFDRAMEPFHDKQDPIRQAAIWEPLDRRFDKYMALTPEQAERDYEDLRERQKQEAIDALYAAKDDIADMQIELNRELYGDEYVDEMLEGPKLFHPWDAFAGFIALSTALGIVAVSGKEV